MTAATLLLTVLVAQPPVEDTRRLLGSSEPTYKRLVEADRKLRAGNAADAAEELQKLIDEAGDDLVSADGRQYRPARTVAQQVLVQLPPAVLQGVRDRTDGPARALVDAGKRDRDPRLLKAAVDRYFPARPTEEALLLLGELAFERGEFRAAETYWRRLLPAAEAGADAPVYPAPTADPATVRAKVVLAVIYQGDRERATAELAEYTRRHPTAAGWLAGTSGRYAATLDRVQNSRPHVGLADAGDGIWTGFAGPPTRNSRTSGPLPRYWPDRPTWAVSFPRESVRQLTPMSGTPTGRTAAYHPVVLGGRVYVSDTARTFAVDLRGGPPRLVYHLGLDGGQANPTGFDLPVPPHSDTDYTLTAADGRLFVRAEGTPGRGADPSASWLVCLDPAGLAAGTDPITPTWRLAPPARPGTAASWEAAPVWAAGRIYAAYTRLDGTTRTYGLACYDDPPGRPVWQTDVATAPVGPATAARPRPEPLTLVGDTLVYCTHAGAVAAVDTRTGKPVWALRYPRPVRGWPGPRPQRDLCPPVADGGRVFVAPHDSDQLYALDTATGRVLWQAGALAVDQLLGVAGGKLIATISRPVPGIRGFDVATGSDRPPHGWATHDDARLRSFGRGLVADNLVFWPTESGVFVLNTADGRPARRPLIGTHGNLAFADGVLLVGTSTGVAGYVTDAFKGNPAVPAPSPPDRLPVRELIAKAEKSIERGDPATATRLLKQGLSADRPESWRVWAAGRLLSLQPRDGGAAGAEQFVTGLGQPAGFTDGWVTPGTGPPTRLRDLIREWFGLPDPPPAPTPPAARPATTVPAPSSLGAAVSVERTTTFPTVCRPLLSLDGGPDLPGLDGEPPFLLVTDGRRVVAIAPQSGQPRWTTPLPTGIVVDRAVVIGPDVVAVGRFGAVKLAIADGRLGWWFTVPDADPLTQPGSDFPRPVLADPAVSGRCLVARLGPAHLIGVDLASGSVAWVLDGLGRREYTPYPLPSVSRFTHLWPAKPGLVIARRSTGERVQLDPDTGTVTDVSPTSPVPWEGPPARLPGRGFVVADGPAALTALAGPETGLWAADFGREASLTGRPPQLLPLADGVLAAVSRNHGVELERVLGAGGTRPWPDGPTLLPTGSLDLSAAAATDTAVFMPVGDRLTAVRLLDGRQVWSVRLPTDTGSRWRVRVGRRAVFVWPAVSRDGADWERAVRRLALFPAVWRLPALAAAAYDAWATAPVPLLAFDPDTGRQLAQLELPAGADAVVSLGRRPVVVGNRRAYWLKSS
ncbi:MAG: PQQ-binding-like beta-propeller repeat protein [Gemmataceae bacterium]